MAMPANSKQLINGGNIKLTIVTETLQNVGIPLQVALKMGRAYYTATDYLKDCKLFLDNYNRFTSLQSAAETIDCNLIESLADKELQKLVKELDDTWDWSFLRSTLPDGAATDQCSAAGGTQKKLSKKQHLKAQIKELKEFKKTWQDTFNSEDAMRQKADEILTRGNWMKIIELAVVFKDVCLGINKAIKTSKLLQEIRADLARIHSDYVEPIIDQFNKYGSVDKGKLELGLMQLRYIRAQCEDQQKETASSFFGHLANTVFMGFQAYASFANGSALADIASEAVINQTKLFGAVQGGLAVSSCILTGVEAYNYIQYQNIIDEVNALIKKLEYYSNSVNKNK